MIIGIGVDLVKIPRMQKMLKRWGDRFLNRVFTDSEITCAQKKKLQHIFLSGRFAAKEAVLKALGIGLQMGVRWQEIETLHDDLGKPVITLSGKVQQIARDRMVSELFVSLSHEGDYAVAQALLTGKAGISAAAI
ncbi:MAG: holo-ACP synthase [Nitrospirae bacterium]|nr:holo-ACP synthase [Candidatus Troglogloeales bacterium]MBI3598845.1 holo-ACP synthase [Candidatus Troglogloeales bacterium]